MNWGGRKPSTSSLNITGLGIDISKYHSFPLADLGTPADYITAFFVHKFMEIFSVHTLDVTLDV